MTMTITFILGSKTHLENTVHCFEYLATYCTEVTQLGPYHDDDDGDVYDVYEDYDDDVYNVYKDANGATLRH